MINPVLFHTQIRQNFSFNEIYWISFVVFLPAILWAGWLNTEFSLKISILFGIILIQEVFFLTTRFSPPYFAYSLLMGTYLAFFLPINLPLIAFVVTPIFSLGFFRFIFGISGYWISPSLSGFLFAFSSWPKTWFDLITHHNTSSILESYDSYHSTIQSKSDTVITTLINNSPLFENLLINVPENYINLIQGQSFYNYLSPLGILFSVIILFRRQIVKWIISFSFILTFFPLIFILEGAFLWKNELFTGDTFFYFLSPTTLLAIFFLSTENQTSPLNQREMILHGVLSGLFSFLFLGLWISSYSILFGVISAQLMVPLLDLHKISYKTPRREIEYTSSIIPNDDSLKESES